MRSWNLRKPHRGWGGGCESSRWGSHPSISVIPLLSPPQCWCQPTIVFWCFLGPTIGLHSQQPKQTFVNLYASGRMRVGGGCPPAASLAAAPSSALTLHSGTSIQHEDTSGNKPPCWKRCHMWLPLFIKLTQARLRCRPFPAFGPAHYSQYLHAILNCWEFPWWQEPPLHEIFRAHRDSREARRRVFTPIWLYDMIFSWAMTVLLN